MRIKTYLLILTSPAYRCLAKFSHGARNRQDVRKNAIIEKIAKETDRKQEVRKIMKNKCLFIRKKNLSALVQQYH